MPQQSKLVASCLAVYAAQVASGSSGADFSIQNMITQDMHDNKKLEVTGKIMKFSLSDAIFSVILRRISFWTHFYVLCNLLFFQCQQKDVL